MHPGSNECPSRQEIMPPEVIDQILESAGDPAYSVDERGNLTGWNHAAERLLGYSKEVVLGQPCHEILQGVDIFGNGYCEAGCPLLDMALRCIPIRHFQMDVRTRDNNPLRVLCFAFKVLDTKPGAFSLVHLLRPANQAIQQLSNQELRARPRLTARELTVLRLLAGGHTTSVMAATLSISPSTVRKHVQNIFDKLNVHSRLGAVLVAFEKGIL